MLPTQELFRSIPCPYYVSGLCERPHCFYRHTKSDVIQARKSELRFNKSSTVSDDEGHSQSSEVPEHPKLKDLGDSNTVPIAASIVDSCYNNVVKPLSETLSEIRKRPAESIVENSSKKPRLKIEDPYAVLHNDILVRKDQVQISCQIDLKKGVPSSNEHLSLDKNINNKECLKTFIHGHTKIESKLSNIELIEIDVIESDHDKIKSEALVSEVSLENTQKTKPNSVSTKTSNSRHRKDGKREDNSDHTKDKKKLSSSTNSRSKQRSHKSSSSSSKHRSSNKTTSRKESSSSKCSKNDDQRDKDKRHKRDDSSSKVSMSNNKSPDDKTDQSNHINEVAGLNLLGTEEFDISEVSSEFRYPEGSDYEDDSDEVAMECLRMFENYIPEEKPAEEREIANSLFSDKPEDSRNSNIDEFGSTRRRMAHPGADKRPFVNSKPQVKTSNNNNSNLGQSIAKRIESQRKIVNQELQPSNNPNMNLNTGGNKNNNAGGNNNNKAGGNNNNKAGENKNNKAGENKNNKAGENKNNKAGGCKNNNAGGTNNNNAGGNKNNNAGGNMNNKAGEKKNNKAGGNVNNKTGGNINKKAGGNMNNNGNLNQNAGGNKKRIAHVPNASKLIRKNSNTERGLPPERQEPLPSSSEVHAQPPGTSNRSYSTVSKTTTKGSARIAHLPTQESKKRPSIYVDSPAKTSKIPSNVRQKVLDQIFDAAINLYSNEQEAFERAIAEECDLENRCFTKSVYLSLAVGKIRNLRRDPMMENPNNFGSLSAGNNTVSHRLILNGAAAANCSILKPFHKFTLPRGNRLYKSLHRYVLTPDQLVENGFPRPHPSGEPGRVLAQSRYWDDTYVSDATRRTCDRCKKVYTVKEDGYQAQLENCTFHAGRKTKERIGRVWQTVFSCCGSESGSDGCTTYGFHVPRSHPVSKTGGFVSTVREAGDESRMGLDPWDIVALDCEMVYTTGGNQLARATFVGSDGQILYDELIKTRNPVLDYNTQFSGLTEEELKKAKVNITEVQAVMLTHVKPNSILIGHSLESDLVALRFKHECVIDTSVLFPHRKGPPFKRALRNLTSEYLKKLIQNSESGHDSAEDARAALNLVYYHLEEEMKSKEHSSSGKHF